MSIRSFFVLLLMLLAAPARAVSPVVPPPPVEAAAWLLMDYHSGRVLASHDVDKRLPPASLTKMATAYVVFHELEQGNLRLEDEIRVSEKAWRMPGSRMFIEVDKQVSIADLLRGLIIQSGNDASVALAEAVAGSEEAFVALMNQHMQRLGLNNTHFVNATGLPDPEHYTSVADLGILAQAMIRDHPDYYSWHAERKFTFNDIVQYNRNKLLWRDKSVDGIKTGHTEAAGYCLVASALRDGMRLIAVVMGTKSEKARARETQKLLNYGFRFFETHPLYEAGKPLTSARVWKGEAESLPLGIASTLYVTVPRGSYDRLKAATRVDGRILAPVAKGERRGTLRVALDGDTLAERPLIALDAVAEGGLWRQVMDHVLLLME